MESPARGPQPCRWGRVWSAGAPVPALGSRVPRVARRAAVPGEHRGNWALTGLGHTAKAPRWSGLRGDRMPQSLSEKRDRLARARRDLALVWGGAAVIGSVVTAVLVLLQ